MATTDNNIKYDRVFFKEFFPKLGFNFTAEQHEAIEQLVDIGLIQRDRLVEMAISEKSGIAMDSTAGQDFANGDDAKTVVLSMRKNNKKKNQWTASFPIYKVSGKNGDILAVAYNKILDKFHYFRIPHAHYQHITHVLEIILERYDGLESEPQWTGKKNVKCKWWEHEKSSFTEMCCG